MWFGGDETAPGASVKHSPLHRARIVDRGQGSPSKSKPQNLLFPTSRQEGVVGFDVVPKTKEEEGGLSGRKFRGLKPSSQFSSLGLHLD